MKDKISVVSPTTWQVERPEWKPGEYYISEVKAEILPEVDVVVCGGGTAGVTAAIAAARTGARTVLIESRGFPGGMLTGGNAGITMFTKFSGRNEDRDRDVKELREDPNELQVAGGIALELVDSLTNEGSALADGNVAGSYVFTSSEDLKRKLFEKLLDAGVELRLHTMIVGVVKEGNTIKAVVLESKSGRQLLPAKQFVDATGDGDVAAFAGAEFLYGVSEHDLCAGQAKPNETMTMGVMFRVANVDLEKVFAWIEEDIPSRFMKQPFGRQELSEVRDRMRNGEMFTFIVLPENGVWLQIYSLPIPGMVTLGCPQIKGLKGTRSEDLSCAEGLISKMIGEWQACYRKIPGFERSFIVDVPEMGVRETRHIIGEHLLGVEEIYHRQQYDDCIGFSAHPVDIHPRPAWLGDVSTAYPPRWYFQIPFRALLVKGIDNLLTAGRCISATHEASGCIRPTVPCMVTGEAAGTAAALAVRRGCSLRELDYGDLRDTLKRSGVKC